MLDHNMDMHLDNVQMDCDYEKISRNVSLID